LVCGDPWLTLWVAILASKLSRTNIPIQVQCHGDFGSTEWKSQRFRNRIKFNLIYLNFQQVVGLRFVDKKQFQNLRSKISSQHLIQIVPVPLSIQTNLLMIKKLKKFNEKNFHIKLLFVGRLENDRGLKNLYRILSILNITKQRFRIYIVGDGTKKNEISCLSNKKFTNLDIQILGYVTGRRLVNLYKEADLLLSLAESESYGRAARESLVCGTPVLAFSSTGITELKKDVNGNAVTIFSHSLQNANLVNLINKAASKKVYKRTVNKLIQLERDKVKQLIEGWIEITG
jgi:glycosyltransferase involved in cell wall biosynthesis